MGFFSWLGSLLDQLVSWLGRVVMAFLEALMWALQRIWDTVVVSLLIGAFGFVAVLYVIFYASYILGETLMEVWDPHQSHKPSETFKLRQAPQSSPLPKNRNEAKVLELTGWYN